MELASPETAEHDKFGPIRRWLIQPNSAEGLISRDANLQWGHLTIGGVSNHQASVGNLFFDLEVEASAIQQTGDSIHKSVGSWLNCFWSFVRLHAGQGLHQSIWKVSGPDERLRVFVRGDPPFEPSERGHHAIVMQNEDQAVTKQRMETILQWCSEGKVPALQFELLLRAYEAALRDDPRNAVIEAATALEVAMTRKIRSVLAAATLPDLHSQLLLGGYEMLRNRLKLLSKLGVALSTNQTKLDEEIGRFRNRVVHGGQSIDMTTAMKVIASARALVEELDPQVAVLP